MSDEPAALPKRPGHDRSPALGALGVLLLLTLPVWILHLASSGDLRRQPPAVVGVGHAFESDSLLSRAEVEPVLEAAHGRINSDYDDRNRWLLWASLATWASFGLSALITLIAGWHGVLVDPDTGTRQAASQVRQKNRRLARGMGLFAAAVSVLTASGANMRSEAERHEAHATKLHMSTNAARRAALQSRPQDPAAAAREALSARELLDEVARLTR